MTQHLTATQKTLLVAGFAGCNERTARRFLDGAWIKGAALRERLEAARARVELLDTTPVASKRSAEEAAR